MLKNNFNKIFMLAFFIDERRQYNSKEEKKNIEGEIERELERGIMSMRKRELKFNQYTLKDISFSTNQPIQGASIATP